MNSEQVLSITPTRNGNAWEAQPPVICGVGENNAVRSLCRTRSGWGAAGFWTAVWTSATILIAAGQLRTSDKIISCHKTKTFYGICIEPNVSTCRIYVLLS